MTAHWDGWTRENPPTKGNHLSNWAEGLGTPWSRPSRRAGSPSSGGQYQQEAPGTSLDPGQSRRGSSPWGTDSLLCERSGDRMCFIHSSWFTSRNKTQELKEMDWNLMAAAKILNLLFGTWASVSGSDLYLKHQFPSSSLLGRVLL